MISMNYSRSRLTIVSTYLFLGLFAPFVAAEDLDSDKDGLKDSLEALIGTDPNRSDSDSDGTSDKREILFQSNPLDPQERVIWVESPKTPQEYQMARLRGLKAKVDRNGKTEETKQELMFLFDRDPYVEFLIKQKRNKALSKESFEQIQADAEARKRESDRKAAIQKQEEELISLQQEVNKIYDEYFNSKSTKYNRENLSNLYEKSKKLVDNLQKKYQSDPKPSNLETYFSARIRMQKIGWELHPETKPASNNSKLDELEDRIEDLEADFPWQAQSATRLWAVWPS